jgi:hypothetical protein
MFSPRKIILQSPNEPRMMTWGHELNSFPQNPKFATTGIAPAYLETLKPSSDSEGMKPTRVHHFPGFTNGNIESDEMLQHIVSHVVRKLSLLSLF